MGRKIARDVAFKLVFGYLFNKDIDFDMSIVNTIEVDCDEQELQYVKDVFCGIKEKYDILSAEIEKCLVGYKLDRVYKIDIAILLLATYELMFSPSLASSIIINEAVDLAKKYSTDKSSTFVNGILATIVKDVR